MAQKKLSNNVILGIGIIVFFILLILPDPTSQEMVSTMDKTFSQNCPEIPVLSSISCKTTQSLWMNLETLERASATLKGKGIPSDIAQDIVGFRALVNQQDPYPILGPEYSKIGIEWDVTWQSTHPPIAFLLVAPVAFLPWNWASAVWAWLMIALIVFTIRCYGISWKAAIGLTPFVLLWPPVTTSLGQLTIIWLFALAAGYKLEQKQSFWSGIVIGLAALTKFFPSIMVISFFLKRKWSALIGFISTFVVSFLILMILHPNSISRYAEINRITSMVMIMRDDNSSLLVNSYRLGGWIGLGLVFLLFFLILWTNRDCFLSSQLFSSPRLWILLSYFSVALLPISWIFSLAPLLPIILLLIFRKKLSTLTIGCCCIAIPCMVPAYGVASVLSFASITFLIGLGLLFDSLPYRLFSAVSLRDLVHSPQAENVPD